MLIGPGDVESGAILSPYNGQVKLIRSLLRQQKKKVPPPPGRAYETAHPNYLIVSQVVKLLTVSKEVIGGVSVDLLICEGPLTHQESKNFKDKRGNHYMCHNN